MRHVSSVVLLALLSPVFSIAQSLTPQEKSSHAGRALAKRAMAVGIIQQTASEAARWEDREAGILVLTDAAQLLWEENPEARAWLIKAWDLTDTIEERENTDALREIWRGSQRSTLRTKILNVATSFDPELADRLLKKLEQTEGDGHGKRGVFDDRTRRSEQLLRLALESIDANPALAMSLAQRSLQDGISFNLQTVLLRLHQKDPSAGNRLFDLALMRLRNSTEAFSEAQVLGSYLFTPGQVAGRLGNGAMTVAVVQVPTPKQTPAQADPIRARNFLTVAHRLMLSVPMSAEDTDKIAGEFLLLANSLAQPFQTYAPDLWSSIQARSSQLGAEIKSSRVPQSSQMHKRLNEEIKKGVSAEEIRRLRVQILEEEAEKEVDPLTRRLKLAEAALATSPEYSEEGKRIADKIDGDEELMRNVISFLYYRAALTYLDGNQLKKAEEIALKVPSSLERAIALIALAQKLSSFKAESEEDAWSEDINRQRAQDLLFEAEKSLSREGASANIAKVRLGKVAISGSFADFAQAVAVINRLERFDCGDSNAPRLGIEGFNTTRFTVPRVNIGFGLGNALMPLINHDFELTAATIDSLVSPSVRGACRMEIARQVLRSVPRPSRPKETAQFKKL